MKSPRSYPSLKVYGFLTFMNLEFHFENIMHYLKNVHTPININKSHLLEELFHLYHLLPTITQYNWYYY